MDDKLKKDLVKIIGQGVQNGFEKNFQKFFNQSFQQAFDQNFQKAFDQSFQKAREEIKNDGISLFNQGVNEIIIPEFERIDKEFIKIENKMTQGFDSVNNRLDNLAIKMDTMAGKQLDDEYQIKKHAEKIAKLESRRVVA